MRAYCFLLGILTIFASPVHAVPLAAYAALPIYDHVAISPDGERLAFVTTVKGKREVAVQSTGNSSDVVRISVGEKIIQQVWWAGKDHLVIYDSKSTNFLAGTQFDIRGLDVYDFKQRKTVKPVTFKRRYSVAFTTLPNAEIPKSEAGLLFTSGAGIYYADLDRQELTLLDTANGGLGIRVSWGANSHGELLTRQTYDENTRTWSLALMKDGKFTEFESSRVDIDLPTIVGFGPEEGVVSFRRKEGDKFVTRRLLVAERKWGEALNEESQGGRYLFDIESSLIVGWEAPGLNPNYIFLNPKIQKAWETVVGRFDGAAVIPVSWTKDWKKVVVKVIDPAIGVGYTLVSSDGSMSYLGNLYAGVGAGDVATIKPVTYTAGDGMQIGGYLTYSRNRPLKSMPLVVFPHDGPGGRDRYNFYWAAQALASQGYLVLQPNYRGSSGVGDAVYQAGIGEWGRKMQSDLSDGVNALAKLGLVDPRRVCVIGHGFGGYMALMAMVAEPAMYRCAISVSGIADHRPLLKTELENARTLETPNFRSQLRGLSAKNLSDPELEERSPVMQAGKIKGNILLIHGDNDSVVPFEQSQLMANALKKADKSVDLIKLKSEDHWLSSPEGRLQMLSETVKFLEKNNPP